ncbi:hypothetical protein Tther_02158 [Tepidimonas thermarum]|uniref:Uncharacterized protein n=1 Tax=Tepidimonas thermarum TaxID=335431 RepID=A0A554WXQ7_9BURK|nr:hypothetical protein [Tepidimonas thermarum]TSE28363.1 hypothetical protein Tther_02158 [Tepidimonas thermarum]
MKRLLVIFGLGGLAAWTAATAQTVACHVAYAGATRTFVVAPVAHDQAPEPLLQGATLALEVINRLPPAPGAGVTVRTLGVRDGTPYLLHQATYLPGPRATGTHGFTGLQVVRDPARGNELAYWCERRDPHRRHARR